MIRSLPIFVAVLILLNFTSCTPREVEIQLEPAKALGAVLAEKTAEIAGKKPIVIISPDASWGPTSTTEEAFRSALKKHSVSIMDTKAVVLGDPMRSGPVGLKATDLLDVITHHPDAGAIVSIAGPPLLRPEDGNPLPENHPPILVVATATLGSVPGIPGSGKNAADLVQANIIQLAIVDSSGNETPAGKNDETHKLFDQNFRIVQSSKPQ